MTEQIAGQNPYIWATVSDVAYDNVLREDDISSLNNAGFTHVAPSTPNYNPYSYVDEFGQQHTEQFFDGFSGQVIYSGYSRFQVRAAALPLHHSA
jgi:hypothetical protein